MSIFFTEYFILSLIGIWIGFSHDILISDYWSWKSSTYGYSNAYITLILLLGLNCNNLLSKSNSTNVALGYRDFKLFVLLTTIFSSIVCAYSDCILYISSLFVSQ